MKRSGPIRRKTPLGRKTPLKTRRIEASRSVSRRSAPKRRGYTPDQSERRRAALRAVVERDGSDRCWIRDHRIDVGEPCFGPSHGHEIIGRYSWANGIFESDNIVFLCNHHNEWVERETVRATELGLRAQAHLHNRRSRMAKAASLRADAVAATVRRR